MKKFVSFVAILGVFVLGWTGGAMGFLPPEKQPRNMGKESPLSPSFSRKVVTPLEGVSSAWEGFNAQYKGKWRMRLNPMTGAPEAILGHKTAPMKGSAEEIAKTFILQNQSFLRIKMPDLTLKEVSERKGWKHIRYEQKYKGIPVEGSNVLVHITKFSEVSALYADYHPNIQIETTPSITANKAIEITRNDLKPGVKQGPRPLPPIPTANLVIFPQRIEGKYYLAYKVKLFCKKPLGEWIYFIDAHKGNILFKYNDLRFSTSGTVKGKIFPSVGSDPLSAVPFANEYVKVNTTQSTTEASGNYNTTETGTISATLEGSYVNVDNEDNLDALYNGTWTVINYGTSSLHPYLDNYDNTWTITQPGATSMRVHFSYFETEEDYDFVIIYDGNDNVIDYYTGSRTAFWSASVKGDTIKIRLLTDNSITDYGFDIDKYSDDYTPISPTAVPSWTWDYPSDDTHCDEVNMSYHVNLIHDYYKNTLDFSNMDYQIHATVHLGDNYANAYYDSETKNISFGDGDGINVFDFARARDCIYHEYTHGAQDHIYSKLYDGQSGAMDEAFADYFAASVTNDPIIGEWVMPSYTRNLVNTNRFPDDWVGEVHDDGLIYSGALWEIRQALGKELADRLIFESLFFQPASFKTGLEAVLLADDDDGDLGNGTPHKTEIEAAFSNHGITLTDSTPPTGSPTTPTDRGIYGSSIITFRWTQGTAKDPESGIAGYYLQVGTSAGGSDKFDGYVGINTLNKEITGCENGKTYYARVKARNGDGLDSDWSGNSDGITIDTTSPTGTPSTPIDGGDYATSTAIIFDWTQGTAEDPESGIAGYYLQVGTSAGGSDTFDGYVGRVTSRIIFGCNGQTYYARVRAVNGAGVDTSYSDNSNGITIDIPILGSVTVWSGTGTFIGTYTTIQAGVNACPEGGTVSVLAGTYTEAVSINKGIALVGNGTPTITSTGAGYTNTVTFDGTATNGASISGFIITGATAGNWPNGNGIYCNNGSPTITNNTISGNYYAGIYGYNCAPTITNNTISGNGWADIDCEDSSSPIITNNIISGSNYGIYCYNNSSPTITNNTISGNYYAGIECDNCAPTITNDIITKNGTTSTDYYGIYVYSGNPTINYNCLWGNGLNGNNNYYNCSGGIGSITANPQFIGSGDYHLGTTSPCIDAGTNTAPGIPATDKDGNSRIYDNHIVDMGAYEFQGYPPPIIADFTSMLTSGAKPLLVQFTDQSRGSITTWLWQFGDGGTSTKQSPAYTYTTTGTYSVSLTVVGPEGTDTKTKADYIVVTEPAPVTVKVYDSLGNFVCGTNTIQKGVNACPTNGKVLVSAGTYTEAVTVNKRISLIGVGTPTIDASGLDETNIVTFEGKATDRAIISGFRITGATGGLLNNGNGIYCHYGSPTITNNIISGNEGGIYCESSSPTITNNIISGNEGGIYCYYFSSPTITNNTISENSMFDIDCCASSPTITNNTISGISMFGIDCYYSFPTITNNIISGNNEGINCYASSPTIINNTISGNGWEGIHCDYFSSPTITNNTISGNGNGIDCYTSSPTITNNTISGNSMFGIDCYTSSPTITNNIISENVNIGISCFSSSPTITNNTISGNGNGIDCYTSSPTITNNTISGNNYGIDCYSSSPTITNNIISGNGWDGILCEDSSLTITNNIISGNGWDGIHCENSSSPTITNNIITENGTTSTDYYGIYNDSGTPTINYNCVWGNGQYGNNNYSSGCPTGANNITTNPQFIGGGDYHLDRTSPCRDAGLNTASGIPATDKDGKRRIVNSIVDIGAYEYQFESNLEKVLVYPNPYYPSKGHTCIYFDRLTENSTIQIFTIAGELVVEIEAKSSRIGWNACNSAGEKVASGIYIYLIKDPAGNKKVGKLGVIR